jgi:hypothetical protein
MTSPLHQIRPSLPSLAVVIMSFANQRQTIVVEDEYKTRQRDDSIVLRQALVAIPVYRWVEQLMNAA